MNNRRTIIGIIAIGSTFLALLNCGSFVFELKRNGKISDEQKAQLQNAIEAGRLAQKALVNKPKGRPYSSEELSGMFGGVVQIPTEIMIYPSAPNESDKSDVAQLRQVVFFLEQRVNSLEASRKVEAAEKFYFWDWKWYEWLYSVLIGAAGIAFSTLIGHATKKTFKLDKT